VGLVFDRAFAVDLVVTVLNLKLTRLTPNRKPNVRNEDTVLENAAVPGKPVVRNHFQHNQQITQVLIKKAYPTALTLSCDQVIWYF
jgi:hypothetical protein